MCGETRIPRDMCAGNTLPGETYITVTPPSSGYCSAGHCKVLIIIIIIIIILPALNIPLFRILPLFFGYSCILIDSVKAILKQCQLTCQQCYQVSTNVAFVLFSTY